MAVDALDGTRGTSKSITEKFWEVDVYGNKLEKMSVGCAPPGSWSARSISDLRNTQNPKNPCLEIADPAGLELQDRSGMDIE